MGRYVPQRGEIVWLDFEPVRGKEIGKYRPAIVLTSRQYNERSGLLIGCPISTSIRGAHTEVPVTSLSQSCVVVSNLVHTLDWRERKAKKSGGCRSGLVARGIVADIAAVWGATRSADRENDAKTTGAS